MLDTMSLWYRTYATSSHCKPAWRYLKENKGKKESLLCNESCVNSLEFKLTVNSLWPQRISSDLWVTEKDTEIRIIEWCSKNFYSKKDPLLPLLNSASSSTSGDLTDPSLRSVLGLVLMDILPCLFAISCMFSFLLNHFHEDSSAPNYLLLKT